MRKADGRCDRGRISHRRIEIRPRVRQSRPGYGAPAYRRMDWLLAANVVAVFLLLVIVFGMSAEHTVTVVIYLIIGTVILLAVLGIRSSKRRNRTG